MVLIRTHAPSIAVAAAAGILLTIFFQSGNALAGWSLLVLAISLPVLVGMIEKQRNSQGKWWLAPIFVVLGMMLIVFGLAFYAVSRI